MCGIIRREQGGNNGIAQMFFGVSWGNCFDNNGSRGEIDFGTTQVIIDVFYIVAFTGHFDLFTAPTFLNVARKTADQGI